MTPRLARPLAVLVVLGLLIVAGCAPEAPRPEGIPIASLLPPPTLPPITPVPTATVPPTPRTVVALPTQTETPAAAPGAPPTATGVATTLATVPWPTETVAPPTVAPPTAEEATATGEPAPEPGGSPTAGPAPQESPTPEATPAPEVTPLPAPSPTPEAPPSREVAALVVTPDDPPTLYAVAIDRLWRSGDRGASWQSADLTGLPAGARVRTVAVDYGGSGTLYIAADTGIYRRTGGEAQPWTLVNTLVARGLAVDLQNPAVLWAGVGYSTEYEAVLLVSHDAGLTWSAAAQGLPRQSWVQQILIDPGDPNILYANVRGYGRFGWPEGALYRGNRDGNWELLRLGPDTGAGACLANGIAYDPGQRRLYVGCDGYYYNENQLTVLMSANPYAPVAEIAWQEVSLFPRGTGPIAYGAARPLAVDARAPHGIYLALGYSEIGVTTETLELLVSHDDGATWSALSLPALEP